MNHGTLKALVRLPSDPDGSARPGKVEFLDNSVQNSTGTVNLRATLSNPYCHFWPGQFVNVKLVLETKNGAVLVPNQAAQISQQGPFVFVIKPDSTAELRPVTLGQRQGDEVVITKGLAAGERVVLAGQLLVRPEGRCKSRSPQAPGPADDGKPAGSEKGGHS